MSIFERCLAALLTVAMAAPMVSAASAQSLGAARSEIMRGYIEHIPVGARVRVTLVDGRRLNATLMMLDGDAVVVRERKRIPEPPLRLSLDRIADVELDQNTGHIGKAIAIGAGAGAAAALGVFFIILASLD
jgi:hypothetical protein